MRYLTKYLTKAVAETYADEGRVDVAYEDHIDRLHEEVRWLPCSKECANWLRFGVQPKDPGPGLIPGHCASKAHDREHLGVGGRRVLVSRGWSGKTLTEHKADRAAVVRAALEAAGIDTPAADRMAAETLHVDGKPLRVGGRACHRTRLRPRRHGHCCRGPPLARAVRPRQDHRRRRGPTCGQPFGNPATHAPRGLTQRRQT